MKGSVLKFILVISIVLNITVLCTAGYQYYRKSAFWTSPFGYKIKKDRFLFEELPLRPDQMKAMRERSRNFRALIDNRRREIAWKRRELLALIRKDSPDRQAVSDMVSEINGMQGQMQEMVAMHMIDMKAGLDKEQQKQFIDLIENAMMEGRQEGCPPVDHQ